MGAKFLCDQMQSVMDTWNHSIGLVLVMQQVTPQGRDFNATKCISWTAK